MNDGGRWLFSVNGKEQSFEEADKYRSRRISDRFTDEMLERYCRALDIDIFNEDLYGPKAAVVNTIQKLNPESPVMSFSERSPMLTGEIRGQIVNEINRLLQEKENRLNRNRNTINTV